MEAVIRTGKIAFQHFKFKFAMAIAAELGTPNVRVASIPEFFDARFPDRDRLAAITGWDRAEIDTVDIYRNSAANYAFPTMKQLLSVVPPSFSRLRLVPVPNHPLGDEWPVLAMEVG